MSCKDFVLYGACERRHRCSHAHDFLYCYPPCGNNTCKRLHVPGVELNQLRYNVRPFTEILQLEVDRMAFTYKNLYGDKAKYICTRHITGLRKCVQECVTCQKIEKYGKDQCE